MDILTIISIFILGYLIGKILRIVILKFYQIYSKECRGKNLPYFPIELSNALIYIFTYIYFGFTIQGVFIALLFSILLGICLIDFKFHIIPDSLNLVVFLLSIIYGFILLGLGEESILDFFNRGYGLILGLSFFFLIAVVTKGAIGGGDIKLIGGLGFFFGFINTIGIIFFSFIIGGMISILLLILKVITKYEFIPFGPFICISAFIMALWGENIIEIFL